MKIVIIEESVNKMGGVERIINYLSNFFVKKNNTVDVISLYRDGKSPFFKYNLNVNIKYLCENKINNRFFQKLADQRNIKKICKKIDKDAIIIFGRVSIAVKFLPFLKNNNKIIVRDAINIYCQSNIVKYLMKKYFPKKVGCFIVSSDESYTEYQKFFGTKKINIKKIYNPLTIIPNKNMFNYNSNIIVSYGRFDKQKGFENLIKSFKKIHEKNPSWILKIYGDGVLKKSYIKIIEQLKLDEFIKIELPCKDVKKILNNTSMFVMTSRYEGYANSLVEALSCGIPSVSFNWLTGVEDIIKENENGKIVKLQNRIDYFSGKDDVRDIENLSNCVNSLINNEDIMNSMSQKAYQIFDSRKPNVILNEWYEIINDLEMKK